MVYKIKSSSGSLLVGSYSFEETPSNIVELPILVDAHFEEISNSLDSGALEIELDGVLVSNPLQVFSALRY